MLRSVTEGSLSLKAFCRNNPLCSAAGKPGSAAVFSVAKKRVFVYTNVYYGEKAAFFILKRIVSVILAVFLILSCFCGCTQEKESGLQIAATTWPVYQFTAAVCEGSGLSVTQVVTGQVSCLHDYTLTVRQMQAIEDADLIIMSGCDLEEFMEDALAGAQDVIECCDGVSFLEGEAHGHGEEEHEHDHEHEADPHIWMDPDNAAIMVDNIAKALSERYPAQAALFSGNAAAYCEQLRALKAYGEETLRELSCRELVTFHDGFAYFAAAFDLTILAALEEEDGAMASAATIEQIIGLVQEHALPAIFTETFGSDSAATVIAAETDVRVFTLSMAMSGEDYLTALRRNIDTVKEALG